jgi:hypothetical protein
MRVLRINDNIVRYASLADQLLDSHCSAHGRTHRKGLSGDHSFGDVSVMVSTAWASPSAVATTWPPDSISTRSRALSTVVPSIKTAETLTVVMSASIRSDSTRARGTCSSQTVCQMPDVGVYLSETFSRACVCVGGWWVGLCVRVRSCGWVGGCGWVAVGRHVCTGPGAVRWVGVSGCENRKTQELRRNTAMNSGHATCRYWRTHLLPCVPGAMMDAARCFPNGCAPSSEGSYTTTMSSLSDSRRPPPTDA